MSRTLALWLSVLVLLVTGALHYAVDPLAASYRDPDLARRTLHYIGQGINGALWPAVVALLALRLRRLYLVPLVLACVWAMAEQLLVAGCQMAAGVDRVLALELWQGLCAAQTDRPTYLGGVLLGGIAAASLLYELQQSHGHDHQCPRR